MAAGIPLGPGGPMLLAAPTPEAMICCVECAMMNRCVEEGILEM
jgi:hypothetical protein